MVKIDTPEFYKIIVNAYVNTSKYEKVPFNPNVINKIIDNFEYLHSKNIIPPVNFYNLLYYEMEEQEKIGFLITPFLRGYIDSHRQINKPHFITYIGELAYLQLARHI